MMKSIPWLLNAFVLCSLTRSLTEVLCFAAGSTLNSPSSSKLNLNLVTPLRSTYASKRFAPVRNVRSWQIRGGQLPGEPNGFELSSSSDSTTVEEYEKSANSDVEGVRINGKSDFTENIEKAKEALKGQKLEIVYNF